jgi:hypothetical protein
MLVCTFKYAFHCGNQALKIHRCSAKTTLLIEVRGDCVFIFDSQGPLQVETR